MGKACWPPQALSGPVLITKRVSKTIVKRKKHIPVSLGEVFGVTGGTGQRVRLWW